MNRHRIGQLGVMIGVLLLAGFAHAQATQPVEPAVAEGKNIIRRVQPSDAAVASSGTPAAVSRPSPIYETAKVVGSLALVVGAILGLKVFATNVLGLRTGTGKANRGVRVLSRTMMGHKQQLVLLQVGRKLVLVADSGGKISPVTEVCDPDEVAELAAQALGKTEKAARFSSAFRGNASKFEDELELSDDSPTDSATDRDRQDGDPQELSELAERVRAIGRRFNAT